MSESAKNRNRRIESASLSETRRTGRTFGCVGFSVLAHMAFLAAIAALPQTFQDIAGGDGTAAGSGSAISMMESGSAAAPVDTSAMVEVTDAPSQPMTDSSSDIVVPSQQVTKPIQETTQASVEKPVIPLPEKTLVKTEAVRKAKPVSTSQTAPPTTPPVAAAAAIAEDRESQIETPQESLEPTPEDSPAETSPAEASTSEPAPTLLANPPSDNEPVPAQEDAEPVDKAPVAVTPVDQATQAEPVQETTARASEASEIPASTANSRSANDNLEREESSSGSGASKTVGSSMGSDDETAGKGQGSQSGKANQGTGTGAGTAIGPIRDASELRALPGNPNPVYPIRDRLARKEGTTIILGRVTPDGRVSDLTVQKSSGSQAMDSASMQAFRSWRFQSGQQGWVRKPFQFRLVGAAKEVPAPLGKSL